MTVPRGKTASQPAPATRGRAPMSYEDYLSKPATGTQQRFADWLTDVVGYNPSGAKTKADAFLDGVRLAVGMRIAFQTSDESQAIVSERKAAKNGGATPAKRGAAAKKTTPAKATKAAKAAPTKSTARKTTAAKAATAPPAKAIKTTKAARPAKAAPPPQAKPKKTTAKVAPPPPPPATEEIDDNDVPF